MAKSITEKKAKELYGMTLCIDRKTTNGGYHAWWEDGDGAVYYKQWYKDRKKSVVKTRARMLLARRMGRAGGGR
jgi:hypothetical protein